MQLLPLQQTSFHHPLAVVPTDGNYLFSYKNLITLHEVFFETVFAAGVLSGNSGVMAVGHLKDRITTG